MDTRCDCGPIFRRYYDISNLYLVVMTFICLIVVIVVLVLLNFKRLMHYEQKSFSITSQ